MRKVLFILAILVTANTALYAQKDSKADKGIKKEEAAAAISAEIKMLMQSKNFQFNPSEVQTKTSKSVRITNYEYMRVYPTSLQIRMTKIDPSERSNYHGDLGTTGLSTEERASGRVGGQASIATTMPFNLETSSFEILQNEPGKKDNWVFRFKTQPDAILTFTINVNCNTGQASMRVESNKEETWTYKGKIVPN